MQYRLVRKPTRDGRIGQQRFHFRTPENLSVSYMVKQGFDPEAVAHEDELVVFPVIQCKSEFTPQVIHEVKPVLLIERERDLAVRLRCELFTFEPQGRANVLV